MALVSKSFRKGLRLLFYFFLSGLILSIIGIGAGYWFLSTRWKLYITPQQMERFSAEINDSPPLPQNFKRVYAVFYPQHLHATMAEKLFYNYAYRYLFQATELDSRPYCHCEDVYYTQIRYNQELRDIEWVTRMRRPEYGFALEKYTTPEKCFDYVMRERIRELKMSLTQQCNLIEKPLDKMNDDDLVELIMLLKSRKKYDRYKNPEVFTEEFQKRKELLAASETNPL